MAQGQQAVSADRWPAIEPGALKHQVTINQESSSRDVYGQPVTTGSPTPVRTTWAGINLVSMREVFGNDQLTSQSTDIWTVRWTPTVIKPGMQIVFGSSIYRIQAVSNPGKRNIYLHLLCLELNATSGS